MIDQLDASGLSVVAFAAAQGVPAQSVYHWRRKLREPADAQANRMDRATLMLTPHC